MEALIQKGSVEIRSMKLVERAEGRTLNVTLDFKSNGGSFGDTFEEEIAPELDHVNSVTIRDFNVET